MIRLYLLIALIALGYWFVRRWSAAELSWQQLFIKKAVLIIVGMLIIILGITGRLNWIMAMIGVVVAYVTRNLPMLLRLFPHLERYWHSYLYSKPSRASADDSQSVGGKMTIAEAYKILGLNPPVMREEIILAHKKLMQKLHPDRGGSDYLASQINLAKDLLLKS